MALPVDRFVTPEQDFAGLYRYSGRLEQNRLRQEQEKQAAAGRKAASDKYFANYLDPKERFTGTMADPVITDKLAKALDQAFELSSKGATDNEIFMAITPLVNDANEYTQKAKAIQAQKKQALEVLGKQKGVDVLKFSSEFDDEVFMETDPKTGVKKMRELSTVDPSQNYADKVLKERDIYNASVFDDFLSSAKPITDTLSTKVTDAKKGMRAAKLSVSAPEYMQPVVVDGVFQRKFEPRYDLFANDGEVVMQPEFDIEGKPVIGSNGQQSQVPIKMAKKEDWSALLRNPATANYLRQEVRKYAKQLGVDIASPQAEHFGRALAWKIMDESNLSKGTFSEMVEQKAQPAPRITVNVNGGGSGSGVNVRDIYTNIKRKTSSNKDKVANLNGLSSTEQSIVLKQARDLLADNDISQEDIYVLETSDGKLHIMKATNPRVMTPSVDEDLGELDYESANLPAQPGVKGKEEVIKIGGNPKPKKDPLGIL